MKKKIRMEKKNNFVKSFYFCNELIKISGYSFNICKVRDSFVV